MVETLEDHGVGFEHAAATAVDPVAHRVTLDDGQVLGYDYLVIATGYRNQTDVVPGFAEHAVTITTLAEAERTALAWQKFLEHPGDVVVAATQGAGCFGAAYEFLFNTPYQLRKAGLHKDVTLTYVTAEPFLGHFGIGGLPHGEYLLGMFLKKEGIGTRLATPIDHVDDGALVLGDGEVLPFAFGMVVPPFLGQEFLLASTDLVDAKGYAGSATPTSRSRTTTCTPSASPPRSTCRGRRRPRSGSPGPATRPRPRRTWRPATSPPRSAARSRATTRSSATSRRSA